ncbi:hypothetical protein BKA69DRAFT_1053030 [Paraphysoderma sedebokerense]|nr:hypothetical protein BKA69DRAFT_1053030 [Paraphysoderma sedebokerense]
MSSASSTPLSADSEGNKYLEILGHYEYREAFPKKSAALKQHELSFLAKRNAAQASQSNASGSNTNSSSPNPPPSQFIPSRQQSVRRNYVSRNNSVALRKRSVASASMHQQARVAARSTGESRLSTVDSSPSFRQLTTDDDVGLKVLFRKSNATMSSLYRMSSFSSAVPPKVSEDERKTTEQSISDVIVSPLSPAISGQLVPTENTHSDAPHSSAEDNFKHILSELVETEVSYVHQLKLFVEYFCKPIQKVSSGFNAVSTAFPNVSTSFPLTFERNVKEELTKLIPPVLTPRDAYIIIRNLPTLLTLHEGILSSMFPNQSLSDLHVPESIDIVQVAQAYSSNAHLLSSYIHYTTYHEASCALMKQMMQSNRDFECFVDYVVGGLNLLIAEDIEKSGIDHGVGTKGIRWSWEDWLIKPIQRLTKYPLLLSQLLKYVPASFEAYKHVECAYDKLCDVLQLVDDERWEFDRDMKTELFWERCASDLSTSISEPLPDMAGPMLHSSALDVIQYFFMPSVSAMNSTVARNRQRFIVKPNDTKYLGCFLFENGHMLGVKTKWREEEYRIKYWWRLVSNPDENGNISSLWDIVQLIGLKDSTYGFRLKSVAGLAPQVSDFYSEDRDLIYHWIGLLFKILYGELPDLETRQSNAKSNDLMYPGWVKAETVDEVHRFASRPATPNLEDDSSKRFSMFDTKSVNKYEVLYSDSKQRSNSFNHRKAPVKGHSPQQSLSSPSIISDNMKRKGKDTKFKDIFTFSAVNTVKSHRKPSSQGESKQLFSSSSQTSSTCETTSDAESDTMETIQTFLRGETTQSSPDLLEKLNEPDTRNDVAFTSLKKQGIWQKLWAKDKIKHPDNLKQRKASGIVNKSGKSVSFPTLPSIPAFSPLTDIALDPLINNGSNAGATKSSTNSKI